MLRADLADARRAWLRGARHDPEEYARREQSDFLCPVNHEGESLDFHSLRHTCGAWLAMGGAHPKAVQAVMRHSTITLTMDTYGHLFPGQEAETVARLPEMLAKEPEARGATGTEDAAASLGQQFGQQLGGKSGRRVANRNPTYHKPRAAPNRCRKSLSCQDMRNAGELWRLSASKRRARDSNPQPASRHLISSQAANQFAYPPAVASQSTGRQPS